MPAAHQHATDAGLHLLGEAILKRWAGSNAECVQAKAGLKGCRVWIEAGQAKFASSHWRVVRAGAAPLALVQSLNPIVTALLTGPLLGEWPFAYLWREGIKRVWGPRWQMISQKPGLLTSACTPTPGHASQMVVNAGQGALVNQPIAFSRMPGTATGSTTVRIRQVGAG